jgi:hypothetical protein
VSVILSGWLIQFVWREVKGKSEGQLLQSAMSQLCAFTSPFLASMSDMEILRQLTFVPFATLISLH